MIAVSVSRSVRSVRDPAEDIAAAVRGNWPVRSDRDRQAIEEHADVTAGLSRGLVVGAYSITGGPYDTEDEPGRLVFDLGPGPDWTAPLLGNPAPELIRFTRGARWPVILVDTDVVWALLHEEPQTISARGHKIEVDAQGNLTVTPPSGASVTVK